MASNNTSHISFTIILSRIARILLGILILIILAGLLGALARTAIDLALFFGSSFQQAVQKLIIDLLTTMALFEVYKIVFSYLSEGRVRVTYVVDTVLIVMLNELLVNWYKGSGEQAILLLLLILVTLIVVRLLAIRFSPDDE